ncbi:hypothetical protein K0M31_000854 [Melipona bicolor]|uniref:Uncharacterized protein n=1 Tax=Melipona bicolor TaxID=60889 RepID=A0AA40GEK0_9HYME|nr:hypothetical protein K0M31_000854 [Melipona bicolor]
MAAVICNDDYDDDNNNNNNNGSSNDSIAAFYGNGDGWLRMNLRDAFRACIPE